MTEEQAAILIRAVGRVADQIAVLNSKLELMTSEGKELYDLFSNPLAQRVERGGDHKPGEAVPEFVAQHVPTSALPKSTVTEIPVTEPEPGTVDADFSESEIAVRTTKDGFRGSCGICGARSDERCLRPEAFHKGDCPRKA